MKLAIMQPYFFPYIGYFQLMNVVDKFIIYDNIKFSKSGWVHRNRILVNGRDSWISLSLQKDSDYLDIRNRYLRDQYLDDNKKLLRRIENAYCKAPYFKVFFGVVEECMHYNSNNLFNFVFYSIKKVSEYLSINTQILVSSNIPIDHSLKKEDKVLAFCEAVGAKEYINLPGGKALYDRAVFSLKGFILMFLDPKLIKYNQGIADFLPHLSIIDVLMFNSTNETREYLNQYNLT